MYGGLRYRDFEDFREDNGAFVDAAALTTDRAEPGPGLETADLQGEAVVGDSFDVLGVSPLLAIAGGGEGRVALVEAIRDRERHRAALGDQRSARSEI